MHRWPVSELRASLAAFRVCSFDSNDCVMLFSENKYDDDDDDDDDDLTVTEVQCGNVFVLRVCSRC